MARPPLGSVYIYFLMAVIGYMLADLVILGIRDDLIPTQRPPDRPQQIQNIVQKERNHYDVIISRNYFNIDGKIPDVIGAKPEDKPGDDNRPPEKTNIPGLVLVGTLVHSKPAKSVASIRTASSGENVGAYRPGAVIDGVGEVLDVERGKMIFRNIVSQRKEYVEIPQEGRINLGISADVTKQVGEVTVTNEFDRSIKRDDVARLTGNLPEVLQQARAVKVGDGFQILDIQPGSIYERLGIKRGDLIKTVNGEAVDSPQKAMQLYNTLKNAGSISLGIERNGRSETMNFTIN